MVLPLRIALALLARPRRWGDCDFDFHREWFWSK